MKRPYAGYEVLDKWASPSFDAKTRRVLEQRLAPARGPRFFSGPEFALLEAVTGRLLPQSDRRAPIPVAAWIDGRLADGLGDGYRNEHAPPAPEAWRRGLAALEAEARLRFERHFVELGPDQQDALLSAVQSGEVRADAWEGLDAKRFFKDPLLKTTAGLYYAHPAAWNEIGFGGPASPRGYVRLGFDERDPWEAEERR